MRNKANEKSKIGNNKPKNIQHRVLLKVCAEDVKNNTIYPVLVKSSNNGSDAKDRNKKSFGTVSNKIR